MANNNKINERKVSDWPVLTEQHWYVVAISLVIIGVVLGAFGLLWVFDADKMRETKDRMGLITPIVTVYLALVTFCTVAWRGMVSSRQADQQKRQNDAKDEENLAKLLVDGTKLVSEKDADSAQVHAGIAALNVVSSSPLGSFAVHAMDILTLVIERTYKDNDQQYVFSAAKDALEIAAQKDRRSTRRIILRSTEDDDILWTAINGCQSITYTGGTFVGREYDAILNKDAVLFSRVVFDQCNISGHDYSFMDCTFNGCAFVWISRNSLVRGTFESCDFSGTIFKLKGAAPSARRKHLEKLREGNSFYKRENPPTGLTPDEISTYFRVTES